MLNLPRHKGEKIMIGDGIVVTVLGIDRGVVRLGIEAPKDVKILRRELLSVREKDELERAGR